VPFLLDEHSKAEILKFYQGSLPAPEAAAVPSAPPSLLRRVGRWLREPPSRKVGDVTVANLLRLREMQRQAGPDPLVLMIGKRVPRINGKPVESVPGLVELERMSLRLDITAGPGVDIVGDGHKLPFRDASLDAAVALTTLKHLRNPFVFAAELHRVLKPGGLVYAQCVLFEPYHRWPGDYVHLTTSGIVQLFSAFEAVDSGVNGGPSYTVSQLLPLYFANLLSFNRKPLYNLVSLLSAWLLSPIRYLDYVCLGSAWKDYLAFSNYFLGRKPR
jgi:SAM-dependent methyltransferase